MHGLKKYHANELGSLGEKVKDTCNEAMARVDMVMRRKLPSIHSSPARRQPFSEIISERSRT